MTTKQEIALQIALAYIEKQGVRPTDPYTNDTMGKELADLFNAIIKNLAVD